MRKGLCKIVIGLAAALTGAAVFAQAYPDRPIKLIVGIGAGGTLGAEAGAKAPADGYTLLSATSSIPIFRHTYTLRFDPEKDLIPVGGVAKGAMVLITRGDDKAPTVAELIARAKNKPQSVSYGSAGIGSNAHLASEVFAQIAGVEPFPMMREALALQIRNESDAWSRKVKSMKLQPQ